MATPDARAEYEESVNAAQADLAKEMADSFQTMRDRIARAWYRYQVRSGNSVPGQPSQEKGIQHGREGKSAVGTRRGRGTVA